MATDPVCTMKVDEETTEFTSVYDGQLITSAPLAKKSLRPTQNSTSLQRSGTGHAGVRCVLQRRYPIDIAMIVAQPEPRVKFPVVNCVQDELVADVP